MHPALQPKHPPSLLRQIGAIHLCIVLVGLAIGSILLHQMLNHVVWEQHRRSVLASAHELIQRLNRDGVAALRGPLPPEEARRFDALTGSMRYAVIGSGGQLLAHSPGAEAALPRREGRSLPSVFQDGADGSRLWGLTESVETPDGPVALQIAEDMDRGYVVLDDIAPAALGPMLLLLALGGLLLFGGNALLLLQALRPLQRAAGEASRIGRGGSQRLSEDDMPEEVRPLIAAVNGGLDRLDDALLWHRGFSEEVAHELRTPLAVMQAELDLLEPGPARDRLLSDLGGLAKLVSDLLEAAEASRDLPAGEVPIDLRALARETAERLAPVAEREGLRVVTPPEGAPLLVQGNRDAIGRAIRNLIENALSHSPPGAPVEVLLPEPPPGEVQVAVADHGRGVPKAERQKVFRRHWRDGDTHRRGLGLGLSIVERIVRAHGGRVEVGDTPGGGALFTISLPGSEPAAALTTLVARGRS